MELNGLKEQTKHKCTIPFHSTSEHPVPTVHILFWIHHVLKKKNYCNYHVKHITSEFDKIWVNRKTDEGIIHWIFMTVYFCNEHCFEFLLNFIFHYAEETFSTALSLVYTEIEAGL